MPRASAAAAAAMRVLEVVRAAQPHLGSAISARRASELAVATREVGVGPPKVTRCARARRARARRGHRDVLRAPGWRRPAAWPRGRPRSCRGGRGGPRSGSAARATRARTPRRPRAGSSSTSQTTVASGVEPPTSDASGVPTLPATATGSPAARWIAPSSSAVVVLPLVPVTATKRFGSSRQASSSSPSTGSPRSSAAAITGASRGTPGLLTTVRDAVEQLHAVAARGAPRRRSGASGPPASQPITSPCSRQHPRRRGARARQADDQVRAPRAAAAWRSRAVDCW